MRRNRLRFLLVFALVTGIVPAVASAAAADSPVFINEIHYDNTGTDSGEAIEVAAPAGTSLDGWSLVLYNGSTGAVYNTIALSGAVADAGSGYGFDVTNLPTNGLQNGAPDGIALVNGASVVQFLSYEGSFAAVGGPADGLTSTDIGVSESSGTEVGHSLQLTGTGSLDTDFTWAAPMASTFGAANTGQTFEGGSEPPVAIINEFDADQVSTDSAEFIELYDGGSGNTALDGLAIVLFNGNGDASYQAFDLDGQSTDGDGYFVLCGNAANTANCDLDVSPDTNLIQNGADAVALYEADAADFPNGTVATETGLIDAVVYDTDDSDDTGLLAVLTPGQPQVNERGGGNGTAHSNQRCPNGSGGARITSSYDQFIPTPGAENVCVAPVELRKIYDIQGSGDSSPLAGTTVKIEGVVVGDFQDTGQNGFYVQEEDSDTDSDPATSDGIFVFEGSSDVEVAVGDLVQVTGDVTEFFGLTEINNVTEVVVLGTGTASAAVLTFPLADPNPEHVEGMLVTIPQDMVITEFFQFDRFNELMIATERLPQPTAIFEPDSQEAIDQADLNARSQILLDDGRTGQNLAPSLHPDGTEFTTSNIFRGGDLLTDVTGVVTESFGYRIHATAPATHTVTNPRPTEPEDVGGDITVASFNVLNYYTTIDQSGAQCFPSMTRSDCRGADSIEEFERQRVKIIAALSDIEADVFGLIEIENNGDVAVADLVAGLNDAMGAGTYDYVAAGTTGPDTIKVALIYKPGTVTPNGAPAILDSMDFLDPNNTGQDRNRAALAQTFTENATGESVTVVVNHFKSKGRSCGAGDDDPISGNCNLTRTLAAEVLTDWLAGDPTATGEPDVLVIGDLNAYDKEDPIDAMKAGADDTLGTSDDYVDLVDLYEGEFAYSFAFSAQWGHLDYAMANMSLMKAVTGTTVWHINADEVDLLDYNTDFKPPELEAIYEPNAFRSSDHDPVIVGLNLADPMGDKERTIDALEALLPTGDKNADKRLTKAIASIAESLTASSWTSDQTITTKKVFDNERDAVVQLMLVAEGDGDAAATAQEAIDVLLNADRLLAQIELIAAADRGGDPTKIAAAEAAMADAAAFAAAGQYADAVNAYKTAWVMARKA